LLTRKIAELLDYPIVSGSRPENGGSDGRGLGTTGVWWPASAPGTIRFTVSGKGANLAPPDGTPVVATLILDAPFATTGQCGEADFGSCKKSKSGNALTRS
jgi:hypothetical protein